MNRPCDSDHAGYSYTIGDKTINGDHTVSLCQIGDGNDIRNLYHIGFGYNIQNVYKIGDLTVHSFQIGGFSRGRV